jgi:hypothetical protein
VKIPALFVLVARYYYGAPTEMVTLTLALDVELDVAVLVLVLVLLLVFLSAIAGPAVIADITTINAATTINRTMRLIFHLLSLIPLHQWELPIKFLFYYPKLSGVNPVEPLFCNFFPFLWADPLRHGITYHKVTAVRESENIPKGQCYWRAKYFCLVSARDHPGDLLGALAW